MTPALELVAWLAAYALLVLAFAKVFKACLRGGPTREDGRGEFRTGYAPRRHSVFERLVRPSRQGVAKGRGSGI